MINQKFLEGRYYLYKKEPYYALFAFRCAVKETKEVETISIFEEKYNFYIAYNPEWIETLSVEQIAMYIKHVLIHLIFGHLTANFPKNNLMEIAKDLAVNSNFKKEDLPSDLIHPYLFNFETGLSTYDYYYKLKKLAKEIPEKGGDNHGIMKAEHDITDKLNQILMQVEKSSSLGDSVKHRIELLLKPSSVYYGNILQRIASNSMIFKRERTWKKPNRRMGPDYKGVKKENIVHLGVYIDESGSISDNEYNNFLSEVEKIYRTCECKIDLTKFTHKVEETIEYKGFYNYEPTRYNGGTNFNPIFEHAEINNYDLVIILTDGFNADTYTYTKPKQVVWVVTKDGNKKQNFGVILTINKKHSERMSAW